MNVFILIIRFIACHFTVPAFAENKLILLSSLFEHENINH